MKAIDDYGTAGAVATPAGREGITALIIDDEEPTRVFLRTALHSLGLKQIHEAANGEEGVARYEQLRPSLVLLDINMPVMAGDEAIQRILGFDPEAIVIMITCESWHDTVRKFLDLGACGYVLKHRSADGVRAALAELLANLETVEAE